ncbi:MAG: ribonuclease III [Clostridia bacterium]|nr:ribonuclease III [Clostridia bacterium]
MEQNQLNGTILAYLGDAVIELIAREKAIERGICEVRRLNQVVPQMVRASAQSEAFGKIEPLLDEEELAIFKKGRNAHGISAPKSASAVEYRRATGMEALFAHLYLCGKRDRLDRLFDAAYGDFLANWEEKIIK